MIIGMMGVVILPFIISEGIQLLFVQFQHITRGIGVRLDRQKYMGS